MKQQPGGYPGPANLPPGSPVSVELAEANNAAELAALAAATFPLACPPSTDASDIAAFIATTLSAERFIEYLTDPGRVVFAARAGGGIVGYAMLVDGDGQGAPESSVELSKLYVLADHHRSGTAAMLLRAGFDWAGQRGARLVWLGVNQNNLRAQRFYAKHGFVVTGTRTFRLGSAVEDDFVMTRALGGTTG